MSRSARKRLLRRCLSAIDPIKIKQKRGRGFSNIMIERTVGVLLPFPNVGNVSIVIVDFDLDA